MNGSSKVNVRVETPSDPGYSATAIMVAESGLLLARKRYVYDHLVCIHGNDRNRFRSAGVITPAVALGDELVTELSKFGFVFDSRDQ